MSLIPITADVERDLETPDAYGGEKTTAALVYTGLTCTFNYLHRLSREERFESTSVGGIRGPGVRTRTAGTVFFERGQLPAGIDIHVNDRIRPNPAVQGLPVAFGVIGVRTYETSLQLDVEAGVVQDEPIGETV